MKQFNLLLQIVAAILAIVVSAMTLQALRKGERIPFDIFAREPEVTVPRPPRAVERAEPDRREIEPRPDREFSGNQSCQAGVIADFVGTNYFICTDRAWQSEEEREDPTGFGANEIYFQREGCEFGIKLNTGRMNSQDEIRFQRTLGGYILDIVCELWPGRPQPSYWPREERPKPMGCIPYEHEALRGNQLCWRVVP